MKWTVSSTKPTRELLKEILRKDATTTQNHLDTSYSKEVTLSKYIWEIKKEYNVTPILK